MNIDQIADVLNVSQILTGHGFSAEPSLIADLIDWKHMSNTEPVETTPPPKSLPAKDDIGEPDF